MCRPGTWRLSARREKHQSSRRPRPPPLSHPVCRWLLILIVALQACLRGTCRTTASASPCPNAGESLSSKSTRRKSPTVPERSRSCYAVSTAPDATASGLSGHHRWASWEPRTEGTVQGNPDMGAYSEKLRGRCSLAGLDHDLEKSAPETRSDFYHQVNAPRRPSCGFHGIQHHSVRFGIGPCHGEAVFRLPRLPIRLRRPCKAGGVEGMDVGCGIHAQGRAPPHVAFGFPRVVPPPYREADRRHHERPRRCPQPPRPPLTALYQHLRIHSLVPQINAGGPWDAPHHALSIPR